MNTGLNAIADLLVRHRLASLETVWALTLPDVRRAMRLLNPDTTAAPSVQDLHALMQAFPDTPTRQEHRDGEH